jgi:hypothetical protein
MTPNTFEYCSECGAGFIARRTQLRFPGYRISQNDESPNRCRVCDSAMEETTYNNDKQ